MRLVLWGNLSTIKCLKHWTHGKSAPSLLTFQLGPVLDPEPPACRWMAHAAAPEPPEVRPFQMSWLPHPHELLPMLPMKLISSLQVPYWGSGIPSVPSRLWLLPEVVSKLMALSIESPSDPRVVRSGACPSSSLCKLVMSATWLMLAKATVWACLEVKNCVGRAVVAALR